MAQDKLQMLDLDEYFNDDYADEAPVAEAKSNKPVEGTFI